MSDVKHEPGCPLATWRDITHSGITGGMGAPRPDCTCGAERIAELEARVRGLEENARVHLQQFRDQDRNLAYAVTRADSLEEENARLESKLAHLRNLIFSDDIEARRLVGEIKRVLEE